MKDVKSVQSWWQSIVLRHLLNRPKSPPRYEYQDWLCLMRLKVFDIAD